MGAVDLSRFKKPREVKRVLDSMLNEKLAGTGITASTGMFLAVMEPGEGLSNRELSDKAGVTKALTTRVTRQLFELGLAENRPEGREYRIFLTEKGEEAREMVVAYAKECLEWLFEDFSDEEIATMERLFKKIDAKVDSYHAPPSR